MPPSFITDIKSTIKSLQSKRLRLSKTSSCRQCDSLVYNLNENIWKERHKGLRKEITFSKDVNCDICSKIRHAFQVSYGQEAGAFDESQSFLLDLNIANNVYMLWPSDKYQNSRSSGQEIYLLPLELPDEKPLGRAVHPQLADAKLLSTWIRSCEDWHGVECNLWNGEPLHNVSDFRVIDVVDSCLVNVPFPSRYLALSYVWGKAEYLTTIKSNVESLEKPGAFNSHAASLPLTIQDAVHLTSLIGERYLWIDALCIVQDDFENKMTLINQMDKIYQGALCTIVAAAGVDSSAGLPGVSLASPRKISQCVINYGEGRCVAISQRLLKNVLGQGKDMCYWNKRAWTHQERLLSGRKLIFLEDGVHFNCQRMTWTEDVAAEVIGVKRHFQMYDFIGVSDKDVYFNGLGPGGGRSLVRKKDEYTLRGKAAALPSFIDYCNLVHGHMGRDLTFEEDVLISFQGILNNLSLSFGSFTQGLSDFYFSLCMLWQPKRFCRRRLQTKGLQTPKQLDLPSWSWAAWVCDIDIDRWRAACDFRCNDEMDDQFCTLPSTTFKLDTDSRQTSALRDAWARYQNVEYDLEEWVFLLGPDWRTDEMRAHFDRGKTRSRYFVHSSDTTRYFIYPIPTPKAMFQTLEVTSPSSSEGKILTFKTEFACLVVTNDDYTYIDCPNAATILAPGGDWGGIITLHEPLTQNGVAHELVKISDGERFVGGIHEKVFPERFYVINQPLVRKTSFYRFVNVLLTRLEDGNRVRTGIGRVRADAWRAAEVREDVINLH